MDPFTAMYGLWLVLLRTVAAGRILPFPGECYCTRIAPHYKVCEVVVHGTKRCSTESRLFHDAR